MLSGSGIGSLGIGVGVDPFLGGSFGGMPDFGPGGIGGALGIPMGVDFNVNLGNASNLDLLNRVAAAVNERYPSQSSAPAPAPTVAPTSRPAPSVPGGTGLAAQELTGDPDMDRMILAARDAQGVSTDAGSSGLTMDQYQQSVADLAEFRNLPENVAYRDTRRPEILAGLAGLAAPFIPGAAAGIAGALGGGALASAATGAALGSGLAAATGQDPIKGALTGALGGFGQGATSGISSLADVASTGASVADTASGVGGALEVLGTVADIARSPIVNAAREYMEARDERPSYTPDLPGAIDVVNIPTEAPGAPEAPGVDIGAPVISQDELDRIAEQEEADRLRREAEAQAEADAQAARDREAQQQAVFDDLMGDLQRGEYVYGDAGAARDSGAITQEQFDVFAEEFDRYTGTTAGARPYTAGQVVESQADRERREAEEQAQAEADREQDIVEGLRRDGWLRNGPWRYDGEGIFTDVTSGAVVYDPTVPEGAKVGDMFDAGSNNDAVPVEEAAEEPKDVAEDEPETGVVIVTPDDFGTDAGAGADTGEDIVVVDDTGTGAAAGEGVGEGAGAGAGDGAGEPAGEGDGTDTGTDEGPPINVTIGAGGLGGAGGGNGGDGGGGDSGQPRGLTGIQALLPTIGLALLGRYLLGEAESGQRRGRLPLEQESATGYYNIDREVRRRMGLGG